MAVRNVLVTDLVVGTKYRIFHRRSSQKLTRCSVMVFLGYNSLDRYATRWSARPVAGTQSLPHGWIIRIEQAPEDTPISINVVQR